MTANSKGTDTNHMQGAVEVHTGKEAAVSVVGAANTFFLSTDRSLSAVNRLANIIRESAEQKAALRIKKALADT
ncbi:MAG: hypothetical protein ACPGOV_00820 [Magnetovibrionaceae bacterium]